VVEDKLKEKPKLTVPKLEKIDPQRRRTSALSLKNLKLEKKEELITDQEEDLSEKPQEEFSNSKLLNQWSSYAAILNDDGQRSLSSVLSANIPEINGNILKLILPNQLMSKQLERGMPGLMRHLRTSLNNFAIQLEIEVKEEVKKKFIYTPEEKYQRLTELNPDIKLLRQRFKLDL